MAAYGSESSAIHARERVFFEGTTLLGQSPDSTDAFGSWDNEWCSEFVSYVYWKAGVALTHPTDTLAPLKWKFSNSGALIKTFTHSLSYVNVEDLKGKRPQLGDYVHIESDDGKWKHSALVLEVRTESSGSETLYTLEGNHYGASLGTYAYPHWRTQKTGAAVVRGIGFRTDLASSSLLK